MIVFQAGAALATELFPDFGPFGTVLLRIGLAALLLGAVWRPWRVRLDRRATVAVLRYGVVLGVMNTLFYVALSRLPLGTAVGIEFAGPLALAIARSRRRADLFWVGLVVLGLLLLVRHLGGEARRPDPVGVACALGAAVGWASYILAGSALGRVLPAGPGTALGMAVATVVALPLGVARLGPLVAHPALLLPALGVATLSSAVPYVLELAAMRRISARVFGVLMSLEPGIAALSGLVFLGEALSPWRWLGLGCVVAASLGTVLERGRTSRGRAPRSRVPRGRAPGGRTVTSVSASAGPRAR